MTGRPFLHVWFPLSWAVTTAAAVLVVWCLWRPMMSLGEKFGQRFQMFVKLAFPAGIALPAFAGFLSVSYFQRGCGTLESWQVMADPQHLHSVAQREVASTANNLLYAIFLWATIYSVLLVIWRLRHRGYASSS